MVAEELKAVAPKTGLKLKLKIKRPPEKPDGTGQDKDGEVKPAAAEAAPVMKLDIIEDVDRCARLAPFALYCLA